MNEIKEFLRNYPVLYETCKIIFYGFFILFMISTVPIIYFILDFIFKNIERIKEEWLGF